MSTLSVLKLDDPYGTNRVLIALRGLRERWMITLVDAALVSWPQGNKRSKTRKPHSTAGAGWGAFWGFLLGMLFLIPLLRAAMGAGMGAISGFLADVGIDDHFVKQVREQGGGHLRPARPDQRGAGAQQGGRRAQAVRLRDRLDQPARAAGGTTSRGLRAGVIESDGAL